MNFRFSFSVWPHYVNMFTEATSNGYERNFSDLIFDFNDSFIQTFARNCLFDLIGKVSGRRIPAINTYFCAESIMEKMCGGAFLLFNFRSEIFRVSKNINILWLLFVLRSMVQQQYRIVLIFAGKYMMHCYFLLQIKYELQC